MDLSFINPDVLIRAWFDPEFNKEQTVINKDAHVSVWNDVKLYVLFILVLSIVVLFMLIASLVKAIRSSFQEGLSTLKTKFVWDYSIQFIYMAYLKLCMTVMNQIDLNNRNSYYWKQNDSNWAIFIGIMLLAAPVAAIFFLWKSDLNNKEVKNKYQNLYSDAALYRNRFAKYYSIAFAIRRILFISIPIMFSEPMMQIMVFMLLHTLYTVGYVAVNPHQDTKRSYVEIFNEISLMILMYHFAAFNGLIADPQVNFSMGYSLIGVILLTLTVNIAFIIFRTVESWRHKKAVDSSRNLVLKQVKELSEKSSLVEMKKSKQQIRNDFILRKMQQAVPINEAIPAETEKAKS